jgi:hypothetical protein
MTIAAITRSLRALAAVVAAALLLAASATHARERAEVAVRRAAQAYAGLERKEVEKLSREIDRVVADPAIVAAFAARDRATLSALVKPHFDRLKGELRVTHWYFYDAEPARTVFLRAHDPARFGDVNTRATLTKAIETKDIGYGKELGKAAFALRVVKPVRSGAEVIGYVEMGEEIEHFLTNIKEQTGDDYGVLVDKARIDRAKLAAVRGEDRWDELPDVVVIDSTMWNERNITLGMPLSKLPADGAFLGEWKDGSARFLGGAFPMRDAENQVVGAVFVRHRI